MKALKAILIILLIIVLAAAGAACYALFLEPHRVTTEDMDISDSEIHKDMTIAVFADTHFAAGNYTMDDFSKAAAEIKTPEPPADTKQ